MTILNRIDAILTDLQDLRSAHVAQQEAIDNAQAGLSRWRIEIPSNAAQGERQYRLKGTGVIYEDTLAWLQGNGYPEATQPDHVRAISQLMVELVATEKPAPLQLEVRFYDQTRINEGGWFDDWQDAEPIHWQPA